MIPFSITSWTSQSIVFEAVLYSCRFLSILFDFQFHEGLIVLSKYFVSGFSSSIHILALAHALAFNIIR